MIYDLYLDISILLDGLVCGIDDYFFLRGHNLQFCPFLIRRGKVDREA